MHTTRLITANILFCFFYFTQPAIAAVFLDWNPLLSELESKKYDYEFLGYNPSNWTAEYSSLNKIKNIYVAAPIHPISYQPGTEYNAVQSDDYNINFSFNSPGIYTARIEFENSIDNYTEFFYVGAAAGKKDGTKQSRITKIEQPFVADIILVETPTEETGDGQGAMADAASIITGEQRVGNVAEAIQKIKDTATAKGGPISVEIVGHGASSAISIGAGTAEIGKYPNKELFDTSQATKDFIAALSGSITGLILKGCSVAESVENPGRDHLMEVLADGLKTTIYAWDQEIFWVQGVDKRPGYAGVDVHGKRSAKDPLPEPPIILLFTIVAIPLMRKLRGQN